MQTCHQCNQRLIAQQDRMPTAPNASFRVRYRCAEGHTGTVEGQTTDDPSEWVHKGEVWPPRKRVDIPEVTQ